MPDESATLFVMMRLERIRSGIENARILSSAVWGAATKKSMLYSPAGEYLEKLKTEPEPSYNPDEKLTQADFTSRIIAANAQNPLSLDHLLTVPWSLRRIKPSRLAASIIAFSNDHGEKTVTEFFPVDEIHTFLQSVKDQAEQAGKQLSLVDQFDIALEQTNNNPVAAALLAHSAYRSVARSCDTRLDERLRFDVNSDSNPINMMSIARSTADFPINDKHDKKDPLGNTYHWWAQFSAGMIFSLLKKEYPLQVRTYNTAFFFGPELTQGIRNGILRMPLAAGDHKNVDKQGLRIGRSMGHLIVNKIQPPKL